MPLARRVLAEAGPTYRPLGNPDLIDAIPGELSGLVAGRTFGWMETAVPPPVVRVTAAVTSAGVARWLSAAELPDATVLLDLSHSGSDARPGISENERWAGVRDDAGRLVALAALVWPAPPVGLIAGVAVHPDARGLGLGRAVCGFVVREAVARHGNAALMVDEGNHAAVRLYRGLGMRYRQLRSAYVQARASR